MSSTTASPSSFVGIGWSPSTTPGRLRLSAAVLVIGAVIVGLFAAAAASSRRDAAQALASTSEPQLVQAEDLYASLSDADATAATTFLTGGIETTARRQRYLSDIAAAGSDLTALARRSGDGPQRRAARTLATQLPVYTGLVEAARANNRQGFPVGAAYLRRASDLMRTTLLNAAEDVYTVEAHRTNADYKTGTANGRLTALAIVAVVFVLLLAVVQFGVARFTNRILNVALVVATVIVVGLAVWIVAGLVSEQNALASAQRRGSDSVQALSAARDLTLRAQRDDSLALIARGGDTTSLADFERAMVALRGERGHGGLLAQTAGLGHSAAQVRTLRSMLARFEVAHRRVAEIERAGNFNSAGGTYIASEVPRADDLNRTLESDTAAAQRRFVSRADAATSSVVGMTFGIPLLVLAVAALAVLGLAPRIGEYR